MFTPAARAEFLAVIQYLRLRNPQAAQRFRDHTEKTLRRLGQFPDSAQRIPEFPGLPHRQVLIEPYRFFLRQSHGELWIVAVWHGAQIPDYPAE